MVFNSLSFIVFILVFFSVYSVLRGRSRFYFILISSYFFYGWWDYRYLGLILVSTFIDYSAAIGIQRESRDARRRLYLILSIVTNLGILFTFKYFNFFSDSLHTMLQHVGMEADAVTVNVLLPVGISFYTFQSMSYTIDVFRGRIDCERDFMTFAIYVSFFPQLVAGPIERAATLIPQIRRLRGPSPDQVREGMFLILWGYFLKVFVADNMSRVVDSYFSPAVTGLTSV